MKENKKSTDIVEAAKLFAKLSPAEKKDTINQMKEVGGRVSVPSLDPKSYP